MRIVMLAMVMIGAGCGGGSSTGGLGASGAVGATPPAGQASATIHLSASGLDQKALTVKAGDEVEFINDDAAAHEIASDPHPAHTDCPELNSGMLAHGQTFTATMGSTAKTCGLHDHLQPGNAAFRGTITISGAPPAPSPTPSPSPTPRRPY